MSGAQDDSVVAHLDDVARLLALQLSRDYETTAEAAVAMSNVGLAPNRIADLLGAKTDSVRKAIQRAKK